VPIEPRPRHAPRLAVAAWGIAVVVLALLAVAVWRYLSGSSGGMTHVGMAGHSHSAADALSRAGGDPFGPLFGTALITAWQLDAIALAVIVLTAAAYLTGVALVSVRQAGRRWPLSRTLFFLSGLAVCAYATCGSIAVYDQVLFTAHMTGHLALVMLAPALLMLGRPLTLAVEAATPRRRDRLLRILGGRTVSLLTTPPVALATYAAVIVGSHLTGVMDTVMRNTWAGQVEHLVYLVAGCQFFALVVGNEPIRWRLSTPARWVLLAVATAVDTFTGIVLMQGTRAVAMVASPSVRVNPLSDTKTGGAIMWFGGDGIMAVFMIWLVIGWLRDAGTPRQADDEGWLEQARRATFAGHTGASGTDAETFDEDDAARASYNEWLARLDRGS
jgi:cytochrome c oxidase assembly factor CtaG